LSDYQALLFYYRVIGMVYLLSLYSNLDYSGVYHTPNFSREVERA